MNKGYTFDDMINTMMPLALWRLGKGWRNLLHGQALVASMSEQKQEQAVRQEKDKHGRTLKEIFSRYCIDYHLSIIS